MATRSRLVYQIPPMVFRRLKLYFRMEEVARFNSVMQSINHKVHMDLVRINEDATRREVYPEDFFQGLQGSEGPADVQHEKSGSYPSRILLLPQALRQGVGKDAGPNSGVSGLRDA